MAGDRCVREDQIGASASSPETVICTTAAATLGPTGLRDTLRLFLRHEGSYTATADTMVMHKNSVKYRTNSAEKAIGKPIRTNRLAIECALTACHWLGSAVLQESPPG